MRKFGINPEGQIPAETTRELDQSNLQAIEDWLSYFKTVADIKEADAELMQQHLMKLYREEWSAFFTKPADAHEPVSILTSEQISQIQQAIDLWRKKETREKQESEQRTFGERIHLNNITTILEKTGLFSRQETELIAGYYLHDSRHIGTDLHFIGLLCRDTHPVESDSTQPYDQTYAVDEQSRRQFEFQLENFALVAHMSAYSEEWLRQIIIERTKERLGSSKPGNQPTLKKDLSEKTITTDPIKQIALPTALVLQRRFFRENYEIVLNPSTDRELQAPSIVIKTKLENLNIPVNPAILTSLVYNLAKNAAKANQSAKYNNPESNNAHTIEIKINEDKKGWNLIVSDTGVGLKTDALLKQAGLMVQQATKEELQAYEKISAKKTVAVLQNWVREKNPLEIRKLNLGQIWDLAKLPRLSGFGLEGNRESSGLGLYGAEYLVKEFKGYVAGANRYDRGAIFVIRIPKNQEVKPSAVSGSTG